ncbi:MAG: hypothetical protein GX295_07780 [Syntrophomonadaceae bacterium]|nr:hypothetical protein [Syntrophomonadaceae bacterium]
MFPKGHWDQAEKMVTDNLWYEMKGLGLVEALNEKGKDYQYSPRLTFNVKDFADNPSEAWVAGQVTWTVNLPPATTEVAVKVVNQGNGQWKIAKINGKWLLSK